jgi:DNA-binding NarL/FixJ family response regulator
MSRSRTRLILADDHHLVAEALKGMLSKRYDVVGVAHGGRELLALLRTLEADCLLLDLSMPERNGLELLPEVRALRPALKILIVTMHLDRGLANATLRAGASGFVPKDSGGEELELAISAVMMGEHYLSPRLPNISYASPLAARHPAMASLTPRQIEILSMLADGKSTAEMAVAAGLSPATITFHRARLRHKLGITSEGGLVRFAILMQLDADREGAARAPATR